MNAIPDKAQKALEILARNQWGLTYCEETGEYLIDADDLDFDVAWKGARKDPAETILVTQELVQQAQPKPALAQ